MKVLAGVDIGTQGTKTVLYSEAGECLAQAFAASSLFQPGGGVVEEDPQEQVQSVCNTLQSCMKDSRIDPKDLSGIGIVGQMAGVIGIGKDGVNVTPYDSWLDTRCAAQILQMERVAGKAVVQSAGAPRIQSWPQKALVDAGTLQHVPPDHIVRAAGRLRGHAALWITGRPSFYRLDISTFFRVRG